MVSYESIADERRQKSQEVLIKIRKEECRERSEMGLGTRGL